MRVIAHSDQPLEEWRVGVSTRMHVSAVNGATGLCIFDQWVAPAMGAPTHSHPVEEVLMVVSGEADMWIDETHVVVSSGSSLIVPAGKKHGFRNIGPSTLHIHAILASATFEASFDTGAVQRWQISTETPPSL